MRRLHRKKNRNPLILALSALTTLIVVATVALAVYGRDLAVGLIHAALGQTGIAVRGLELTSVRPTGATFANVRLGGAGGPEAKAVQVTWTPLGLLRGEVNRVRIDGLVLALRVVNGRLVITGLPLAGGGGGVSALPLQRIELHDVAIAVALPAGKAALAGDASVVPVSGGFGGDGRIAVKWQPADGTPLPLAFDVAKWHVATAGDLAAEIAARVRHDTAHPAIAPLDVRATGQMRKGSFAFKGEIASENLLSAAFDGAHDMAAGKGHATLDLAPLTFIADGKQPVDLIPGMGKAVERVEGTLSGRAVLDWGKAGPVTRLDLKLAGVGFEASALRVSALAGEVKLDSILPPRTAAAQALTLKLHLPSVDEVPVELRVALPGDNRLLIERAKLGIAGGTLALADVSLKQDEPVATSVTVKGVDLGTVLALIGVDGLSGTGMLDGEVPLRIDPAGVAIPGGKLSSRAPGTLKYTGGALPDVDGESGDSVRLLRQALADFRYDSLILTVDHQATGGDSLLIALRGHNPTVLDSHPFAINVRLDADFQRLATVLFEGYEAFGGMLRRASKR